MKTFKAILSVLLVTFLVGNGCKKDEDKTSKLAGEATLSACKLGGGIQNDIVLEAVRYKALNSKELSINNTNIYVSCPSKSVKVEYTVNENTITITEVVEPIPESNCICPKDIAFTISGLESKNYTVKIFRSSLLIADFPIVFNSSCEGIAYPKIQ